MSAPRIGLWGCLALLGGCSLINHGVSQLERMKSHQASGDLQTNAQESITCADRDTECYQLHLIKGDACYGLSLRADGQARSPFDSCTAEELGKGLSLAPSTQTTPLGETRLYARKRMEALHDLIDHRTAKDAGTVDALAKAATEFRQQYASDPAGPYYLASARLTSVEDRYFDTTNAPELCAALPDIESLIHTGSSAPGDLEPQYTNIQKTVDALRRTGRCT